MAMLNWLILIIIIVPPSMFFHEIGHACFASMRGVPRIDVGIGFGKEFFSFRIRNVHVHLSLFFLFGAYASYSGEDDLTYGDKALISLGGPLFSMAAALLCWWGFFEFRFNLLFTFMFFNAWLALINLIPYKIKHKKSDGYAFIEAILLRTFRKNS